VFSAVPRVSLQELLHRALNTLRARSQLLHELTATGGLLDLWVALYDSAGEALPAALLAERGELGIDLSLLVSSAKAPKRTTKANQLRGGRRLVKAVKKARRRT
jgi:hypothetical protein